ncbi:MAG: DUF1254 domain-containing protein [Burkholderiaceae bacterium]
MSTNENLVNEGRAALARAAGLIGTVYGYPLIETFRTCTLQTSAGGRQRADGASSDARMRINTLHHAKRPSTDRDRDVVTPANDLLYTMGWINLANGPMLLTIPAANQDPDRYFVLPLYDAYTENFANLGPRNCDRDGETVALVGPGARMTDPGFTGRTIECPTNLVWLIGRILARDESDWPQARALQAGIRLEPAAGTTPLSSSTTVSAWAGKPVDVMAAMLEPSQPAAEVAAAFFTNLSHAMAETPGSVRDEGLVALLAQGGLIASAEFRWDGLEPVVRDALVQGFEEGIKLIGAAGGKRSPKPWRISAATGRYGVDYLARARTAYLGLGALAAEEAIYAASHFDADKAGLDGNHRYVIRFEADDMPPADAFWSITLYDQDRFLYTNEIDRFSIGDRTLGIEKGADGSLEIVIGHQRPASTSNWLPAPAGRFYLILRLYYPREEVRGWTIPPLRKVGVVA